MKKLIFCLILATVSMTGFGVFAELDSGEQILLNIERSGVTYVVPAGYSNMGTIEDDRPYAVLYSQTDSDIFSHQIQIQVSEVGKYNTLLKNITTTKQAEEIYSKFPLTADDKLIAASVKSIGSEKYVVMEMERTTSEGENARVIVAHVIKNNRMYGFLFVDNTGSFATNVKVFDNLLKTVKIKDFSKKSAPYVGKTVTAHGTKSSLSITLPEGYFVQNSAFGNVNTQLISNVRNKFLTIDVYNETAGVPFYNKEMFSIPNDKKLVEYLKTRDEFTLQRTHEGAGNQTLLNAYIKTIRGEKVYVIKSVFKFQPAYGMTAPDATQTLVQVYKNGSLYSMVFDRPDAYSEKSVNDIIQSVVVKNTATKR